MVTDYHARAVCFASGDPTGLSVTLPGALAQLREVLGPDTKIMLGFDRGGSYPEVFRACRDAGADWLTWRRGDLAPSTAAPVRSFRVGPAGTCEAITLADEMVEINGYGPARQLTLFEHDQPVMQILTSDLTAPAAALLAWLRCRWRIENAFKYLSAHHGIDALADYHADIDPDTTQIPNPARVAARKRLAAAQAALADAERALAQLLASDQHHTVINNAIPAAEARITAAHHAVAAAKTQRNTHPAKLPANHIDPDAKRARLRTHRRALQMVLRLLAYNAEHWLATAVQRLPARPRRVPGDHPQPAPPRRHHHLHPPNDHRRPRPPGHPPTHPRRPPTPRRDQHQPAPAARRPPPDHLPHHPDMIHINNRCEPSSGGLGPRRKRRGHAAPGVQHHEGRLFWTAISGGDKYGCWARRWSVAGPWRSVVPRMWRCYSSFGYPCELGPVPVVRRA